MFAIIAHRMYHVVDCESFSIICIGVTRDVLTYIVHYMPLTALRAKGHNTLLLPTTIYTIFLLVRDVDTYKEIEIKTHQILIK